MGPHYVRSIYLHLISKRALLSCLKAPLWEFRVWRSLWALLSGFDGPRDHTKQVRV